eukprot:gene9561-1850_t
MSDTKNWLDLETNDKVVALGFFETETVAIPRGMMGKIEDSDGEYWKIKFDGYTRAQWIFRQNHLLAGVAPKETTGTVSRWKGNYGFGVTYDDENIHFHKKNIDGDISDLAVPKPGALFAFEKAEEPKGLTGRAIRPLVPDDNSCVGQIVKANKAASMGFISSAQRVKDTFFHFSEFEGDSPPATGMQVSFSVRPGRKDFSFEAHSVRPLQTFGLTGGGKGCGKLIAGTKSRNNKAGKGYGRGKGGKHIIVNDGDYTPYPAP